MLKQLLIALCVLLPAAPSLAQLPQGTLVRGLVRDSLSKTPLEFATVMVSAANGSPAGYATTDRDGKFEIKNVAAGRWQLQVSFLGYVTATRRITVGEGPLDVGTVWLDEDRVRLGEVVVTEVGNAMIVKKDTIEYNASSFKVTEGAVLEDLVKKLPGAEIDSEGKITVGGKEITKVMIDGKTFFSDDPQIATKNLPANMIDKVQVVDRKSEQAQFTGIDDGNEETVLNLTVRPGMKNGWFGSLSGGAGYENRYQGGGIASLLSDNRQLSVIASGNNTNNRGFNDFAGTMMQQGRGGGGGGFGGGGMGGMRSMNVGGARMSIGGNGITTSWLGGVNYHDAFGESLKLGGNYFYNGTETNIVGQTHRQNIFGHDSLSFYHQASTSTTRTQGHRAALELEWTLNDRSSILFKPNVNYGLGSFNEAASYTTTLATVEDTVNSGHSRSFGDNTSLSVNGDLLFRHRFRTQGRTFSANVVFGYSRNQGEGNNYSLTRLGGPPALSDTIDQQYRSENLSYTLHTRLSYTEPLGNNYYAEVAYGIRTNYTTSDKETYDADFAGQYTLPDSLYSNHYRNLFVNQQAELNFRSVREKYTWTVGVNAQPAYLRSEGRGGAEAFARSTVNFSPNGNFVYNFSGTRQLRVDYRGRTSQPSLSQLQPVPDNANPLLERMGNPELDPEFSHNFRVFYRNTHTGTFRTTVAMFNASVTSQKIVNNILYESTTGRQLTVPVNVSGVYSLRGFFMINTPFRRGSKFSIMSNTFALFSQNASLSQTVPVIDPDLVNHLLGNSSKGYTRTLSLNEMLRIGYKGTRLDINLTGRAGYSQAWYSLEEREQPAYWNNSLGGDLNWSLPWGLSLASDVSYNFYIGYADGYNAPSLVWNAEVSKLLFRQKQGTLTVRVFDLLNEGRGNNRQVTDNYIEDTSVNTLGRYVMLTFTYRFGSFGNQTRPNTMFGPRRRMN
jgi:hypothetical protein